MELVTLPPEIVQNLVEMIVNVFEYNNLNFVLKDNMFITNREEFNTYCVRNWMTLNICKNLYVCSNKQPHCNYTPHDPQTDLISCIQRACFRHRDTSRKPNHALPERGAWHNQGSAHICKPFFTTT